MYSDPILKKYIDLIKAKNGEIKAAYQGDPIKIPASSLPCIIVSRQETRAQQITNAEDQHAMGIIITVVSDIRAELSTAVGEDRIAKGISKLYDMVEGRDDATFILKPTSILQILRSNQLVDSAHNLRTDLSSVTRIDYGSTLRQRQPELWSVEARIQIIAQFIQVRA